MEQSNKYIRSPKSVLKYYYFTEGLLLIVGLIISGVLLFLTNHFEWWKPIYYIIVVGMIFDILYFIVTPLIKYKFTFYKIEEDYVAISKQFFFQKTELVKFERTQLIKRNSNPILHKLSLSKTSILTAGHIVDLPLIHKQDAEKFEMTILSYLRGADFDV
ncbi:MAG TPA: PH domain-containing protein [Staphylococcus kloosii]|jgi:membrane protein YdbS with pleckstrin-like domain|uniref:PH domain-containing protein n=1 Tax=Staphylococcus kloosii TaxID=29384 RepID=A0A921KWW8_9STAP|nr:PH domain-containing protein [Staphylococcus kloosii]MBF7030899.1 PH domain-containing protein [Staphylococcus kloosii]HJF67478.1 PH domain-containing protein [Staphylococcus kloosii]